MKTIFALLAAQLLSGQDLMVYRPMNQICFWGHAKEGVVSENDVDYYKLALPVPGTFTVTYKGESKTVTVNKSEPRGLSFPGEIAFPKGQKGDIVTVEVNHKVSRYVLGCGLTLCFPVQGKRIK
jgi:hypothetical protein